MATIYEEIGSPSDATASKETTYSMSVGDTFNGILDEKFDEDWIKIELEKGKTYKINLSGTGKLGDEAEDTILKLFDANGNHIVTNDDIDTANQIYDSQLVYTATTSGTYYLSASSYTSNPNRDNSGAYELTVEDYELVVGTSIKGTNASNRLTGTSAGEKISGLGGNDTLYGRGGDDELDGGTGNDTLVGGAGADELTGGSGSDTASYAGSTAAVTVRLHDPSSTRGGDAQGDSFEETVSFTYTDKGKRVTKDLSDIENLTGSDHDDILAGDARANRLSGGRGDDIIYGGPGGDHRNSDTMYGGSGDDKLYGGRGDDKLYGSSGDDELRGGPDDDTLDGGSGTDKLYGGDGDDILDGGSGDDILNGGDGEDIYRFSQDDGDDDIKGFNTSRRDGDRIDLTDFEDIDSMDNLDIKQRGSDTRIDLDGYDGGEIWLLDFDKDDLDDDDFIFYSDRDDNRDDGRDDDRDDGRDDDGTGTTTDEDIRPIGGDPNDDIYYGTSGNNSKNTGDGDDVLYGGPGDDVLRGGPGKDSYEGGPGSDTIIVDVADFIDEEGMARVEEDAIDGGQNPVGPENSDTLSFGDWVDTENNQGVTVDLANRTVMHDGVTVTRVFKNIEHLIGSQYVDSLTGDGGNNTIKGGDGDDTLNGEGGDDLLEGGAGMDSLDGGPEGDGGDTASYESSNAGVTINLGETAASDRANSGHAAGDTLTEIENIIGSRHVDTLTGDSDDNVIEGGAGGDTLNGGSSGTDTLSYAGSSSRVDVDLGEGVMKDVGGSEQRVIAKSSGGHASGDDVIHDTFENIIGSRHGDILTGNSGDNKLEGGPGADRLDGKEGTDTASYARATAGVTVDLTESGRGRGDAAGDRFTSIEKYGGSAHDDTFIASENNDDINGAAHGEGGDTVSYERSEAGVAVTLSGLQTDSTENSYADGDTLNGIENVTGSGHDDTLDGDSNANVLKGGNGDDTLDGGGGNDMLEGGDDRDILTGGSANDIFKFARGDGDDDITDFNNGDNKIDLTAFTDIASIEDLEDDISVVSGSTEIGLPGGGKITLQNYTSDLSNDDFIFYERPIRVSDRSDTLNGKDDKADTLRGGKGNDRLFGKGGNDVLYGGEGDDQLTGGTGADFMHGGKGSDTFFMTYEENVNDMGVYGEGDLDEDGTVESDEMGDDVDPMSIDTITYEGWVDTAHQAQVTVNLTTNSGTGATSVEGIENIIGSRYVDSLTGDGGNNTIKGGDGDDTLNGAGGDDLLEGGAGMDSLDGGPEGDGGDTASYESSNAGVTINLGETAASDRANSGHAAGDTLTEIENIIGSRHVDTLTGDSDDNVIEGGAGGDTLNGGSSGTDTLSYAGSSSRVDVDLGEGVMKDVGGSEQRVIAKSSGGHASGDDVIHDTFENIIGSRHGDILTGNSGDNKLEGGPGADRLDGKEGTDTASYARATAGVTVDLTESGRGRGDAAGDRFTSIEKYGGSAHDDTFIASENNDDINGAAHGEGGDTVSYERSEAGVAVTLSGLQTDSTENSYADGDTLNGIENVTGSGHDDTLDGDSNANVLKGGNGDDTLDGGGGNDMLEGGDDRDILTGGSANDIFKFARGDGDDDITDFNNGDNKIDLTAFTDIASIEDLEDDIAVRSGNTEIDLPGGGKITLTGYTTALTDDDFMFYTSIIDGTSGSNTLKGDRRGNEINAGAGNDQVFGNDGRDVLNGGAGDDTIYGGAHNDTLNGGEGDDILDGGPGADTFVFEPGNGNDYIMDFNKDGVAANEDTIDLSAFGSISPTITIVDGNSVIDLTAFDGGMITVLGVSDLNTSDLFFGQ